MKHNQILKRSKIIFPEKFLARAKTAIKEFSMEMVK
jgi:hypothetical protein